MIALQVVALLVVALGGWATVVTRDPTRQAVVGALYGLSLSVLFFAFQAPDVALSNIVVGAVIVPALTLLAIAKVQGPR